MAPNGKGKERFVLNFKLRGWHQTTTSSIVRGFQLKPMLEAKDPLALHNNMGCPTCQMPVEDNVNGLRGNHLNHFYSSWTETVWVNLNIIDMRSPILVASLNFEKKTWTGTSTGSTSGFAGAMADATSSWTWTWSNGANHLQPALPSASVFVSACIQHEITNSSSNSLVWVCYAHCHFKLLVIVKY